MSTPKIALGVAAGYLLGRRKKMRLAVAVGGLLAGQRIATNPAGMIRQANELIDKNPDLADLKQRVTGELYDSARSAAMASATSSVDSLNRSLTSRREAPADRGESPEEADDSGSGKETGVESEEAPAKEDAAKKASSTKKAPAKKSSAPKSTTKKASSTKKAPAKKSTASKSTASKSSAKKTSAKKSAGGNSRSGSGS